MNAINNPQAARRVAAPVMDAMQNASVRTGVDFDYLVDVARVESGYNPTAKASTSSARASDFLLMLRQSTTTSTS